MRNSFCLLRSLCCKFVLAESSDQDCKNSEDDLLGGLRSYPKSIREDFCYISLICWPEIQKYSLKKVNIVEMDYWGRSDEIINLNAKRMMVVEL